MERAGKIVTLDPWGHRVASDFACEIAAGLVIKPSIAVASGRLNMAEIVQARAAGRLAADGRILDSQGGAQRHQDRHRARLVPSWPRPPARTRRDGYAPGAGRPVRRHVSRTRRAPGPETLPAADGRRQRLSHRRSAKARQSCDDDRLPHPRRVQRLGRLRLGSLHLPLLSRLWRRRLRPHRAGRRAGHHRLQPQRGPGAWRGGEIPRLQCTPARRRGRHGGPVFRAYRSRRRRPGSAAAASDGRRAALAWRDAASTAGFP